jgi:serine/threonine-protein kinase
MILNGLQAIHDAEIVHLNLTPDRIFLTKEGVPKIGDFFDSFCMFDGRSHESVRSVGEISYSAQAPERRWDSSAIGFHSDIFSVGVIGFELLTGAVPFPDRQLAEPKSKNWSLVEAPLFKTHPQLGEVLKRALAIDPSNRYQSAREMNISLQMAKLDVSVQ